MCQFWLKIYLKKTAHKTAYLHQFIGSLRSVAVKLSCSLKQKVSQIKPPKPCCKSSWYGVTFWTGRLTSCNLWLPGNIRKMAGLKQLWSPPIKRPVLNASKVLFSRLKWDQSNCKQNACCYSCIIIPQCNKPDDNINIRTDNGRWLCWCDVGQASINVNI